MEKQIGRAKLGLYQLKEGKAAPAESMIGGVIKDAQESFNSNLDDSADDSQESFEVEVTN